MDILEDIKKLDAFLANPNVECSDSDSVHTEDLGIDCIPTSKDSDLDEPETEVDYSFDENPEVKETIANCSDNNLRYALICNRKKKHILTKIHNKLKATLKKLDQFQVAKNNKLPSANERKSGLRIRLGAPYFKDKTSYPCPPNTDIVAMRNNERMLKFSYKHIIWRPDEKTKLAVAVYTEISEKRLAEILRLIQSRADTSSDLLKLKDIFGNKLLIGELARNWAEDTLENVEEEIAKIKSELKSNSDCNTKASSSGLHVGSEASTSSGKSKFKLIFEPSTRVLDDNTKKLIETLTKKIRAEREKRKNLRRKKSDSELNVIKNTVELTDEKTKGKRSEYSKLTPSCSNATIIDTSLKLAEQGGSSENPKPSTSYATNIDLNSDSNKSNPITFENESSECGKSLDIIDLVSDFPKHITRVSPCKQREKRDLIALQANRTILRCISNWSKQDIDWYKISLAHFEGRHEDFECSTLWNVYLNPSFSKKPWTDLQSASLKKHTVANNYENWDLIAKNLNINKSGYQCCVHFHSKLAQKFDSDSWTPDEDAELKQLVNLCRFGANISWGKVAFYFRNRSRVQIYNRYRYALAPVKKGTFSEAEDVLLLTLVKIYDKDMTRIVPYFKDRQVQQLRNRLASMTGNIREWSLEDDKAIIQHVHKHGEKDWKLLSDLGRNPAHLRHRFTFIKKFFEMHPTAPLDQILRRKKDKHKLRSQKRSQITDLLVEQLTLEAKGHANNSKILNIPYIESQLKKIPAFTTTTTNKVITGRKPKSKLNIDELLLNYFKPTHKHTGRAITNVDNHLDQSVEQIRVIWSMLNVHLEIPSDEVLENHPKLDAFDVKVLSKLKQMPLLPDQMQSYVIPPTPETLVGYRGLWLLHPRLCDQSKGIIEGLFYADTEAPLFKKVQGYHFCKTQLDQYLSSLSNEMKQEVLNERQLFWKRFYVLFKWPCLLSILPKIPEVPKTTVAKPVKSMQIGRPKKNTTRIQLMNDARLEKKRKAMEEMQDTVDIVELGPDKKLKIN